MAVVVQISSAMKALLCIGAAVPEAAGICASKANIGTGFPLLGRCRSLSFPRSTGSFIRAPLCGCSRDPPTPLPEDSDNRQDEGGNDVDIVQDVTHAWMEPWEMLLDHIFRPPGTDKLLVQLMEPVNKLLQDSEIGNEEYDALLALIQVYFNLKDYEKAKAIQGRIRDCKIGSLMDSRLHLLEAIVNLTLAMEKLRQGDKEGDKESKMLIESAEESWKAYKKLKEEGFGLQEPTVDEE